MGAGAYSIFTSGCLQSNRSGRGFSSRKATLRRASLCRVEVKML
jgi:hypothetical protein